MRKGERKGMDPFRVMISFEDAKGRLMRSVRPVSRTEAVTMECASGRVSASDVVSRIDVPPFDRAAMDGFAVIASDTYGSKPHAPRTLRLVDLVDVGSIPMRIISKGECAQIATGAPMPKGADSVVMVEDTDVGGKKVRVQAPVHPGENVGKRGEDIRAGDTVVRSGSFLNPSKVGACAAVGIDSVKVYARPNVALIPSGEELVAPGRRLEPGKIYDVNSYTLDALVRANGCAPVRYASMRDEPGDIANAIKRAIRECDMVVLSGGSSVGSKDYVLDVLAKLGRVEFHGIAIKPGKPTLLGIIAGKLVLGMPGYPTSCLTNGYALLVDALRALARLPLYEPRSIVLPMAHRMTSTTGRVQLVPVKIEREKVRSVFKESGAITSLSAADGYMVIPADVDLIEKGEMVEVIFF